ncbi:MAG: glucose-1-phosphate cytidylyltransferase [Actinobacteria bacterium]|nr:glucose-1-phosphate cytidylyltransferase [Actinomycetota bacterium]
MNINSAFILAGGKGTRLKEITKSVPKPMIEIINKPLLIHLINFYKSYGVVNIYVLTGYKHDFIVNYFKKNFTEVKKDTFLLDNNCRVSLVFTGLNSLTAKRIQKGIKKLNEENFYLTYGDGLSDVDLLKLTKSFYDNKSIATVTAVRPPARFGSLELKNNSVVSFGEKKQTESGWINGGFFVMSQGVEKYLSDKNEPFEGPPLEKLSKDNKLSAYKHNGFWQCVDTLREKEILEESIRSGEFKVL